MDNLGTYLLKQFEELKGEISEADKVMAATLLLNYAELSSRALAGEDVEEKLKIVKAGLANIKVGLESNALKRARELIFTGLTSLLTKLL